MVILTQAPRDLSMRPALTFDLFCTVIDNHGDLGVCWRLSRQLREAGHKVRLWLDDASALAWMAPGLALGQEPGIELRPWQEAEQLARLRSLSPADVWIEAFACRIPEAFVAHGAATQRRQPVWINLEYLSAEAWVERNHALPSPILSGPARGWSKRFFYPGFTTKTGGLLRESDLLARQQAFDSSVWRKAHAPELQDRSRLISLFCYEPAALPHLLQQTVEDQWLVTPGRPWAALQMALPMLTQAPPCTALPYTDQNGFDEMLWACDLNFVRGEDSWVRALWAGKPFVWQIYPQQDQAHHAKLEAFLDWMEAPPSWRQFHRCWNAIETGPLPSLDAQTLASWAQCAASARQRLLDQDDLLTQLIGMVRAEQAHLAD
ncbi:MAG: elongation factor P maturation arginine rhamnosyltransferase EarP [Betaproteobacteria bacterium]|nr:elongation factor P maturation arginine rhamnosyltransferase EarP [Betaproteobacteria bacterium]